MKLSTLLLSLIPGVGQIHAGRPRAGILLFLLFAVCLNGCLIAPFVTSGRTARILLLVAAALVWTWSWVNCLRGAPDPDKSSPAAEPQRERVYDDR